MQAECFNVIDLSLQENSLKQSYSLLSLSMFFQFIIPLASLLLMNSARKPMELVQAVDLVPGTFIGERIKK